MWLKVNGKVFLFCVLIGFCALAYAQTEADDLTKKKTTSTSTTTSTTIAPTTTTTSTTNAPTTTQPTKPTTTTSAPPTTTSAPPTTTVKPTPTPKPSIGKWNTSCIIIQMAAQFNFTYETKDNKTVEGIFNFPATAIVEDSTCGNGTVQQIVLEWGSADAKNSLTMEFDKNGTQFYLYIVHLILHLDDKEFPNAKENQTRGMLYQGRTFNTPLQMSYHCTREQVLNMTATVQDPKVVGSVHLTDLQFEAFKTGNSSKFSTAKDCDAMDTPDIVPIAVGIALAALILVVLISYLVARRRVSTEGYVSF